MKQKPTKKCENGVQLRPASIEEAGLFYSELDQKQDEALGTVGHIRMDFGSGGKEFWHTWWPHNEDRFNTLEFKEELQAIVDTLRANGPLKDLASMSNYCHKNGGTITEDSRSFGYVAETDHYRYCLRCTPTPGDYQGYLYCYDKRQQEMAQKDKIVGRVTFADGTAQEFTDPHQYLQTIKEELPLRNTTGFKHETLSEDPEIKKAVDDILLDFAGEENPRRTCNYGLTEKGLQALQDVADPSLPHSYAWFVMTDCNTPQEQLHRIVDLDRRADDKTNASALILGNSGQGKTYLLRLLLCNVLEAGKCAISLDSEHEMEDLCRNLGGCFLDFMDGRHRINLLEPRRWDDGSEPDDPDAPPAFHGTLLAQHISFLRDIFRVYKDFDVPHIDTLELMIERLYRKWGINDKTDFSRMLPTDYPILSDLYDTIEDAYQNYEDEEALKLYPPEMLRDLLLGLHSMCKGADARFFNGHTNISSARFLVFCVKGLDSVAQNLRDTLLFSVLSYMSDQLLSAGNTVAAIDELYLWLTNPVAVTYIRNCLKRVRKKESSLFLASQNLEDFDQPGVRELTRPLFAIPTHQFIFNAGAIDKKFYMENLQLEEAEYELIRYPQRGVCLYKCGTDRHLLAVHAPSHKEQLFGSAGGR